MHANTPTRQHLPDCFNHGVRGSAWTRLDGREARGRSKRGCGGCGAGVGDRPVWSLAGGRPSLQVGAAASSEGGGPRNLAVNLLACFLYKQSMPLRLARLQSRSERGGGTCMPHVRKAGGQVEALTPLASCRNHPRVSSERPVVSRHLDDQRALSSRTDPSLINAACGCGQNPTGL